MARRRGKKKDAAPVESDETITPDQLRSQFRQLSGEADELATEFRSKAIAAGAVAAALVLVIVFLIGRSRGKKATTVVEIVRV
jgi:hypothetical protein